MVVSSAENSSTKSRGRICKAGFRKHLAGGKRRKGVKRGAKRQGGFLLFASTHLTRQVIESERRMDVHEISPCFWKKARRKKRGEKEG